MCRIFTIVVVFLFSISFPAWNADSSPLKADKILVEKSRRQLTLIYQGQTVKTYAISLGPNPVGHKQQEGDGRTPEGTYRIDYRNPHSAFHLSLHISYPNASDRADAKKRGAKPGGNIFLHGGSSPSSIVMPETRDWTLGCIAVTHSEIEEIWKAVVDGTVIEIRP